MKSLPKLYYFNIWSRAEPIRLAFSYFNIEYEDVILPAPYEGQEQKEKWQKAQKQFQFGLVPALDIDGHRLSESKAIVKYIMNKYDTKAILTPHLIWQIDSLVDHYGDMDWKFYQSFWEKQQHEYKKDFKEFVCKSLPVTLQVVSNRLKQSQNGKFLVGDCMTSADVVWVHFFDTMILNKQFYVAKNLIDQKVIVDSAMSKFPLVEEYLEVRRNDFPRLKTRGTSSL